MRSWKRSVIALLAALCIMAAMPLAAMATETGEPLAGEGSSEEMPLVNSDVSSETPPPSSEPDPPPSSEPPVVTSQPPPVTSQPVEENTNLKGFAVTAGGKDIKQYFSWNGPTTHIISGKVPYSVTEITVTAIAENPDAQITIVPSSASLNVGKNDNVIKVTIKDGEKTAYYTFNITREQQEQPVTSAQVGSSSRRPASSDNTIIDWETSLPETSTTPSSSSSEAPVSSEEEVSSSPEGTENHRDSEWMTVVAVLLIVLGVGGIALVVCDILYTKGILKKWIFPLKKTRAAPPPDSAQGRGAEEEEMEDVSQLLPEDEKPDVAENDEDWNDFFRGK